MNKINLGSARLRKGVWIALYQAHEQADSNDIRHALNHVMRSHQIGHLRYLDAAGSRHSIGGIDIEIITGGQPRVSWVSLASKPLTPHFKESEMIQYAVGCQIGGRNFEFVCMANSASDAIAAARAAYGPALVVFSTRRA